MRFPVPPSSWWPTPAFTRPIAVPRPVHAEVRPELQAAVEPDQEVLALCLDGIDALADDAVDLRDRTGSLGAGREDVAADQVRPETGRGPEERVALRHGTLRGAPAK